MMEKRHITHYDENWQGYTLEELRYQRAVALARIEMEKEKISLQASDLRQRVPALGGHGIMGKVMGSLSYIDYVILAFKLGRTLTKAYRGFRKH